MLAAHDLLLLQYPLQLLDAPQVLLLPPLGIVMLLSDEMVVVSSTSSYSQRSEGRLTSTEKLPLVSRPWRLSCLW